ncbi:MAG TPA: cell envelope integrity EipB family protein [Methylovirgula sp.]
MVSCIKNRSALASPVLLVLATAGFLAIPVFAAAAPPRLPGLSDSKSAIESIPLASHRAVYDLTLLKSTGSKSPTYARGRIAFDFSGSSCEGYTQTFRQLTELQPAEGPTRISDMRSTTFEDAAGKSFAFKMQTRVDNEPTDEVDGRAQRILVGPVAVALAKPKRESLGVDRSVLFPTEHLKYIIAAAKSGQHILEEKVYDGSETGEKIFQTTTFIGAPATNSPGESAVRIPLLKDMRRWPVTISYFDMSRKDELPNYILSFDLYENGISRALRLDYGDFVLAGQMTSLELLPTPACAK